MHTATTGLYHWFIHNPPLSSLCLPSVTHLICTNLTCRHTDRYKETFLFTVFMSQPRLCNSQYIHLILFLTRTSNEYWPNNATLPQYMSHLSLTSYLHFPLKNIHCTPLYIWFDEGFTSPSDYHSYQTTHQTRLRRKKRSSGSWVQEKKKTGGKGTGCKNIKMEIIHLSRSVWQLEPPFDNVMHKIMYARCEGHWEMLKNICCYVPRFFSFKKERQVAGFLQPEQCFLVPVSLWRAAPLVHRILSSECLIQLASQ